MGCHAKGILRKWFTGFIKLFARRWYLKQVATEKSYYSYTSLHFDDTAVCVEMCLVSQSLWPLCSYSAHTLACLSNYSTWLHNLWLSVNLRSDIEWRTYIPGMVCLSRTSHRYWHIIERRDRWACKTSAVILSPTSFWNVRVSFVLPRLKIKINTSTVIESLNPVHVQGMPLTGFVGWKSTCTQNFDNRTNIYHFAPIHSCIILILLFWQCAVVEEFQ